MKKLLNWQNKHIIITVFILLILQLITIGITSNIIFIITLIHLTQQFYSIKHHLF